MGGRDCKTGVEGDELGNAIAVIVDIRVGSLVIVLVVAATLVLVGMVLTHTVADIDPDEP